MEQKVTPSLAPGTGGSKKPAWQEPGLALLARGLSWKGSIRSQEGGALPWHQPSEKTLHRSVWNVPWRFQTNPHHRRRKTAVFSSPTAVVENINTTGKVALGPQIDMWAAGVAKVIFMQFIFKPDPRCLCSLRLCSQGLWAPGELSVERSGQG